MPMSTGTEMSQFRRPCPEKLLAAFGLRFRLPPGASATDHGCPVESCGLVTLRLTWKRTAHRRRPLTILDLAAVAPRQLTTQGAVPRARVATRLNLGD